MTRKLIVVAAVTLAAGLGVAAAPPVSAANADVVVCPDQNRERWSECDQP
jgi:hypothetical protein